MSLTSVLDSVASSTSELEGSDFSPLSDDALVAASSDLAAARRRIDAASAGAAAEVARRSHRDLGYAGLAQRLGFRTPELLVQQVAGVSRREAASLVRVGSLDDDSPVHDSVASGALSIEAADLISVGLGSSTGPVVARLVAQAPLLTLEQLAVRVRALRDELDSAGAAERENELRDRRYLRLTSQTDGMVRLAGLLDPESAALVTDAFDAVTSPRRGGPRFADRAKANFSRAAESDDPRTLDQLMADTLVDIVRVAAGADPGVLFGHRRPTVRVIVSERDLRANAGVAHLENGSASVSLATAVRQACDGGVQAIVVGDADNSDNGGDPLRLGRTQRLFSPAQRVALAARDAGCRFPGCDRPPSWCEAHHITPWSRGGKTDVADGVLLCRHHHLLVHNNGWQIRRSSHGLEVIPPPGIDPRQVPRPMGEVGQQWRRAVMQR